MAFTDYERSIDDRIAKTESMARERSLLQLFRTEIISKANIRFVEKVPSACMFASDGVSKSSDLGRPHSFTQVEGSRHHPAYSARISFDSQW